MISVQKTCGVSTNRGHRTKNISELRIPWLNLDFTKRGFHYSGLKAWSDVPIDLREISSLDQLMINSIELVVFGIKQKIKMHIWYLTDNVAISLFCPDLSPRVCKLPSRLRSWIHNIRCIHASWHGLSLLRNGIIRWMQWNWLDFGDETWWEQGKVALITFKIHQPNPHWFFQIQWLIHDRG